MSKLISLIFGYALIFLIIIAYYKINNLRIPFSNWGGWKKDVKLKNQKTTFLKKVVVVVK